MKKLLLTLTLLLTVFAFAITTVNAQSLKDAGGVFEKVAGAGGAGAQAAGTNPEDIVGKGIGAAITLVGMIFMALMVYAGYLWMTARGEEEQVQKAQKIITAALIGFFIVASAYAITKFVSGKLGGGAGEPTEVASQEGCVFDTGKAAKYCKKFEEGHKSIDCNAVPFCEWHSLGGKCVLKEDSGSIQTCPGLKEESCGTVPQCSWKD